MKVGSNSLCPCGSAQKYKKCCAIFHRGSSAKTALQLMKSRYSAFVCNEYKYIIKTTHPENSDYTQDVNTWKNSILEFSKNTQFKGLTILEFIEEERESFVTFHAQLFQNATDISFTEKSRFLKQNNQWLYHSAEFINE